MIGSLPPRWMRVGTSDSPGGEAAARSAVESALLGDEAALVILFVSPSYDIGAVARAASAAADGTPMIGCSTAGEIGNGTAGSGRVVAVAIGGSGVHARTAVGVLADGAAEAGRAAAQGLIDIAAPHRALLLLSEGLTGHRSEIVRGAYGVGGASVKLVGGCAGDELAMTGTWQIHDGRVFSDAVVGAALGSEGPFGVGVGHGWWRSGEAMVVTESDGDRVFRLDDEPALDYYLTRIGAPPEAFRDPGAWLRPTQRHPLGLERPGGVEIRAFYGVDYGDRSLLCSDMPQGAIVWILEGGADAVLAGTEAACAEALADLGGTPPIGLLAFDCTARRTMLGDDRLPEEMRIIARHAGAAPVAGFYTYGEIARRRGSRGIYGQTLVVLALG